MASDSDDVDSPHPRDWKKSPKIIIIGAGIAGLSAGNVFSSNGIDDFTILEASDRVGGRILSLDLVSGQGRGDATFNWHGNCGSRLWLGELWRIRRANQTLQAVKTSNGTKAELGANWVHGVDQNPIFKLACQNGIISKSDNAQGKKLGQKVMFSLENGDPVNTKVVEEVDWTFGMLMSQVEDFYQMQIPTPVENDSVGDFLRREFCYKMERYAGNDFKIRQMIFEQRMLNESVICGSDTLYDVSLAEIGGFKELPGVHYVIPGGFEAILPIITQNIPSTKIHFNHIVTQISWKSDQQSSNGALNANNRYPVCVQCGNGKKFYADHVVVTMSLGYLKKYGARIFNPTLPEFKLGAIERLAFGVVDKIVLEFNEPVLPKGVTRLECIWDQEKSEHEDLRHNWMKKIGSFEAITEKVLVGWLCGKEAEYMETLTDQEVTQDMLDLLKSFARTSSLPPLTRMVRSRWQNQPYICGAYTYIPVGATLDDIETLAEPATDQDDVPVLLFAGEATHVEFYSSSHGAYLSGQREANRITDLYSH